MESSTNGYRLPKEMQSKVHKTNKEHSLNTISQSFKDNFRKFWFFVERKRQEDRDVALSLHSAMKQCHNSRNGTERDTVYAKHLSSLEGVRKLTMNLKTIKATGPDDIPAFILGLAVTELVPTFALFK